MLPQDGQSVVRAGRIKAAGRAEKRTQGPLIQADQHLRDADGNDVQSPLSATLKDGLPRNEVKLEIEREDGTRLWLEVNTAVVSRARTCRSRQRISARSRPSENSPNGKLTGPEGIVIGAIAMNSRTSISRVVKPSPLRSSYSRKSPPKVAASHSSAP